MRSINTVFSAAFLALFSALPSSNALFAQTYDATVSDSAGQVITGWGLFPDQCCGRINPDVPLVYDAGYTELGATITRIRLWYDYASDNLGTIVTGTDSTTGLSHIYYLLRQAQKRGVNDWYLAPWTAPTPMCVNGSKLVAQQYEASYCNWIVRSIDWLVNTKGMPLPKGVCCINEPSDLGYPAAQAVRIAKLLKTTLSNYGQSNLRTIPTLTNDNNTYHNFDLTSDTSYWNSADIYSCHSYYWGPSSSCIPGDPDTFVNTCNKYGKNKPRWMTENCPDVDKGYTPWMSQPNQLGHAISMTQQLACDLGYVGCTKWFWWSLYDPWCLPGGRIDSAQSDVLVEGNGRTTLVRSKTFYVLKKIWNEAKVGSVVHTVTSTDPNFKNGHAFFADGVAFVFSGKTIVVLINDSNTSKTYIVHGLTGTIATVFQTTATQDMATVDTPVIVGSSISSIALPPLSVTVVVTDGMVGTSRQKRSLDIASEKVIFLGGAIKLPEKQLYHISLFDCRGAALYRSDVAGPCIWKILPRFSRTQIAQVNVNGHSSTGLVAVRF